MFTVAPRELEKHNFQSSVFPTFCRTASKAVLRGSAEIVHAKNHSDNRCNGDADPSIEMRSVCARKQEKKNRNCTRGIVSRDSQALRAASKCTNKTNVAWSSNSSWQMALNQIVGVCSLAALHGANVRKLRPHLSIWDHGELESKKKRKKKRLWSVCYRSYDW